MSIDWEELLSNAESLPATMLAECLATDADDMKEMLVVWRSKDDGIHYKGTGLSDRLKALGLLEAAKMFVWENMGDES